MPRDTRVIHQLALHNFEYMRRISLISGGIIFTSGVAMMAADLLSDGPVHPLWSLYGVVRYSLFCWGMWLILHPLLSPRLLPIHRSPVTAAEQNAYRNWLYFYGRPRQGIWAAMLRGFLAALAILIALGLYPLVWYSGYRFRSEVLVVWAIIMAAAIYALIRYYVEPQRAQKQAWLAEHFPASPDHENGSTSASARGG